MKREERSKEHGISQHELKEFLEEKYDLFNRPSFIETDPIQIPHQFTKPEDIEIAGFLTATIAWGLRANIIKSAKKLISLMDNSPYDFIINAEENDFEIFNEFKYRTFQGVDCVYFMKSLQNIYKNHNGLRSIFESKVKETNCIKEALIHFRRIFFEILHPTRTQKHIANIEKKSSGKRLNMYLMWMVRNDNRGVHFGLWKNISPSLLYLPLDVHTGNVGRKLGLLTRKQNDWPAVEELTASLRQFDANDPVRFDFSLFGLGVFEKF